MKKAPPRAYGVWQFVLSVSNSKREEGLCCNTDFGFIDTEIAIDDNEEGGKREKKEEKNIIKN